MMFGEGVQLEGGIGTGVGGGNEVTVCIMGVMVGCGGGHKGELRTKGLTAGCFGRSQV